jgi:hypothetical protein
MRNAFGVLVTKTEGKGTFGRHCVDGDNIKMNVKEIVSDSVDRMYLAQDWGHWWVIYLVNTAYVTMLTVGLII